MQVGIDIDFGGHGLCGFGDTTTLKNSQISLSDHGLYSPWSSKNLIDQNRLRKFMQVGIDVTCMYIDFLVGVASLISEIPPLSKTAKFPFLTMDYSPWSSKNSMDRNRLNKFKQVGIDIKCMHTNFGGCDLFGFGDTATFKNGQISLSDHGI